MWSIAIKHVLIGRNEHSRAACIAHGGLARAAILGRFVTAFSVDRRRADTKLLAGNTSRAWVGRGWGWG
jgi:hypothetical protein